MKKPKRKPKFYKGQVVFSKTSAAYAKIKEVLNARVPMAVGAFRNSYYYVNSSGGGYMEKDLRPLSAKEKGPRRERGQ